MTVLVADDLDLDVARLLAVPLHEHLGVAERGLRFVATHRPRVEELFLLVDDLHAATTAAGARLEDHREADALRGLEQRDLVVDSRRAGQHRHARFRHRGARADLVAHQAHRLGRRTDPRQLALLADLGEVGVLGEKAIAGMHGVGAGDFGGRDDHRHVEVALARRRRADADRFVGELDVQRVGVGGRVHGDGLETHLATRADHAQRDLAAISDQDFLEHG